MQAKKRPGMAGALVLRAVDADCVIQPITTCN
jgi:hypothetical protein